MHSYNRRSFFANKRIFAVCAIVLAAFFMVMRWTPATHTDSADDQAQNTVTLTDSQLSAVTITPAATHRFRAEKEVIGNIAYNEKTGGTDTMPASRKSKYAVANVSESDAPFIRTGQKVEATVLAYPHSVFEGKVSALGVTIYDSGTGNPAVDPNTHRITARCEISDPDNKLYPGMLATLTIEVAAPVEAVAVPEKGIVRDGDGTMTVWVTADRKRFEKRTVKIGIKQDGYDEITDGVKPGELVVSDNALFLSNMNNGNASD